MKKSFAVAAFLLAVIVPYLLAWPVPIEPVSWQAPVDKGYL